MTPLRGRGLEIDDPLGPRSSADRTADEAPEGREVAKADGSAGTHAAEGSEGRPSARGSARRATRRQRPTAAAVDVANSDDGLWREWTGLTGVGSFRLPHELLEELGDIARGHQLPVGLIVTAAITQLLDQPADTIVALVDRADDARIQGRRRMRRQRTQGADD
jgi:hypothetical protein